MWDIPANCYSVLKHIVLGTIIGSQRLVVSVIPHVSHVEGDGRHFRVQTNHIKKVNDIHHDICYRNHIFIGLKPTILHRGGFRVILPLYLMPHVT